MTKLELIEDIDKVWHYATMRVQYVAVVLTAAWASMTQEQQSQLLETLGLRPDQFALVSIGMLVLNTVLARITQTKAE